MDDSFDAFTGEYDNEYDEYDDQHSRDQHDLSTSTQAGHRISPEVHHLLRKTAKLVVRQKVELSLQPGDADTRGSTGPFGLGCVEDNCEHSDALSAFGCDSFEPRLDLLPGYQVLFGGNPRSYRQFSAQSPTKIGPLTKAPESRWARQARAGICVLSTFLIRTRTAYSS